MRVLADLEYSDLLTLDAYVPDAPLGAILLLHGGWLEGDKNGETVLAERLCKSGFLVLAANYRLDRTGPNGRALTDAVAALRWLRGSDFDFDRARIAVLGIGTGGTVAIEVGLQQGVPVVAWSPLIDFKGFMDSSATLGDSDHLRDYHGVSWEMIKDAGEQVPFLRGVILAMVANNLSLLASTSPLSRVTPKAAPTLLFNSTNEIIPARGTSLMQEAMTDSCVPCKISFLEGSRHGSEYLLSALPSTIQFFRESFSHDHLAATQDTKGTVKPQPGDIETVVSVGLQPSV